MAVKSPPLTPIPSGVQKSDPQLYQYLKRLEDLVRDMATKIETLQTQVDILRSQ